jgi:hypothetical protein
LEDRSVPYKYKKRKDAKQLSISFDSNSTNQLEKVRGLEEGKGIRYAGDGINLTFTFRLIWQSRVTPFSFTNVNSSVGRCGFSEGDY